MRNPQPWLRKSTGTWHVWFNGKQRYLGRDEAAAFEKFRRMAQSGVTGEYTVRQVVQAYWKWAKRNLAESTCTRRKPILESFSRAMRPSLKADALRAMHVQDWLDERRKITSVPKGKRGEKQATAKPLSPTTIGDYITLIKGVMNWAKGMGYIDRNPIDGMPKPSANVRQDFLPVDTWQRVLELATDEAFRDYLTVMLASGARPVEMGRFEAKHLTGNRLILPIRQSKGRRRSRVVYLPDEALAIVNRLVAQYPTGRLFRNSDGNPWNKDSIRCRFRRLKRELKMPTLTATTLRHSYAHHRLSSGQDSLTVSKLMGHVDTRMLATRYGHLDANANYMTEAANGVSFPSLPAVSPNPVV
ncbi:MAG: tyrosine-type recombinase/integrase [Pirellulales bacterium]